MPDLLEVDKDTEVTTLLGGIVHDAQNLIGQQLKLFQIEMKNELKRGKEAAIPFAIGVFTALVGAIVLAFASSHLLVWVWPDLPFWAALGIVGTVLAASGGTLVCLGKCKFDSLKQLPDDSIAGLQENIQWKTKT